MFVAPMHPTSSPAGVTIAPPPAQGYRPPSSWRLNPTGAASGRSRAMRRASLNTIVMTVFPASPGTSRTYRREAAI